MRLLERQVGKTLCIALLLVGCASQPPLISYPPSNGLDGNSPGEVSRSEEEYGRAMMRPFSESVSSDPHAGQVFHGEGLSFDSDTEAMGADGAVSRSERDEPRGFFGVVVDVIAFPFRAVGWLVQSVF
jgi:hypothetical protein